MNCPKCGTPMKKWGFKRYPSGKVSKRWRCPKCLVTAVRPITPEDSKLVREVVAKVLASKLQVKIHE